MKGLRPINDLAPLNAGDLGFYLVTWMKGLRLTNTLQLVEEKIGFYLVTWMKGLRRISVTDGVGTPSTVFTLWPEWRDYDDEYAISSNTIFSMFLPCDLNEGITTDFKSVRHQLTGNLVFTLWPEWRDYDSVIGPEVSGNRLSFLPCDLNEGITTRRFPSLCRGSHHVFTLWPEWRDYDNLACSFHNCLLKW